MAIGAPPTFAVGDWWEWRTTNELTGEVRQYRRSIAKIDADGVTMDNGWVRDLFGNTIKEWWNGKLRTFVPSAMFYLFPMTPGASWSGRVIEGGDGYDGINDITLRIVGEEEIDTPMGRMKGIKVERSGDWKNKKSGKTGTTRWTFWYHGPAKSGIRFERSNTTSDGKVLVKETQELVAFGSK